ncbi:excalibur calcium-binding domain-containing protein [Streptomyces sp. NPDC048845]|uniref:excalibur calcium-binding domain-containing protein n=1 Tax=Streptomyces sp. NPDC048845 TaxID=3155390 RepID=UPI0034476148
MSQFGNPGIPGPGPGRPGPGGLAAPDVRPLRRRKRVWAGGALLFFIGAGCASLGTAAGDGSPGKGAEPGPTVTASATVTATADPEPRPAVTATKTEKVTETVTVTGEAADADGSSGGTSSGDGGGGGSVHYENCAAAQAAGAAPVRTGDAGYGRHLDRDGDGVACE